MMTSFAIKIHRDFSSLFKLGGYPFAGSTLRQYVFLNPNYGLGPTHIRYFIPPTIADKFQVAHRDENLNTANHTLSLHTHASTG